MRAKEATTFEYSEFEYEVIKESEEGFEDGKLYLKESTIEKLEKLNENLKFAVIGRKRIKVLNYAGVVEFGDVRLEILPKFLKKSYGKGLLTPDEVESRDKILSNLLIMLKYAQKLNVREAEIAALGYEKGDFFEIFVYLFAKNLLNLLKYKIDADYIRKYQELGFVKGKIDVRRYSSNPAKLHRIPCTFYERSMDTPISKTLKYVCYLLSKKVKAQENYRLLKQILAILDPVTLSPVDADYVRKITFNRLNIEFKPFISFCETILKSSSLSLQGSQIEFFSILFPMEKLFEVFIAEVIRKERLHEKVFGDCKFYVQKSFGHLVIAPKESFALKPDIVIEFGNNKVIVDTKYKLLDKEDKNFGVSQQDLYQMYAYCQEINAKKALLLYPEELNGKEIERMFVFRGGIEVYVRTISLSEDLRSNWKTFVESLKKALACLQKND